MFKGLTSASLIDDGESETASPASTRFGARGEDDLSPVRFGAQKFFPGNVYGLDTGIEDLFAKATTLGDGEQRAELRQDGAALNAAERGKRDGERVVDGVEYACCGCGWGWGAHGDLSCLE